MSVYLVCKRVAAYPDSVHRDQPQVSVFKPEWIHAVVKKGKDMSAVPIGSYFLPPHHVPVKSKTTEVILPIVPEVRIAKATQEETNVEMGTSDQNFLIEQSVLSLHIHRYPLVYMNTCSVAEL